MTDTEAEDTEFEPVKLECPMCRKEKLLFDFYRKTFAKDGRPLSSKLVEYCNVCQPDFEPNEKVIQHTEGSRLAGKMMKAEVPERDILDFLDFKYPGVFKQREGN